MTVTTPQRYTCRRCGEVFSIIRPADRKPQVCPRCYSREIDEYNACSLEIGPPPWTFHCHNCDAKFQVTAPRGPDEAKAMRCPACRSSNVKWTALATAGCPTGG